MVMSYMEKLAVLEYRVENVRKKIRHVGMKLDEMNAELDEIERVWERVHEK